MSNVLVVYSSHYGHSERIAREMARTAEQSGHVVAVRDVRESPELEGYDHVMLCGSIHAGRHPGRLERWVRKERARLAERRTLFASVSLSAQGPVGSESYGQARACVDEMVHRTGFNPSRVELVAGDLPYTKYNPFIRWVLRSIVRKQGGPTDTSRDYEFTDWPAVTRFTQRFLGEPLTAPAWPGEPAAASRLASADGSAARTSSTPPA